MTTKANRRENQGLPGLLGLGASALVCAAGVSIASALCAPALAALTGLGAGQSSAACVAGLGVAAVAMLRRG